MKLVMDDHDASRYGRLYVARSDLDLARAYAVHIMKKGWFTPSFMRRRSVPLQQNAFTSGMIISYGRVYSNSSGRPDLPDKITSLSSAERILHKQIRALRNKVIAHADAEMYTTQPWSSGEFSTHIVGYPYPHFSKAELTMFLGMTARTIENIQSAQRKILTKYVDESVIETLLNT